MLQPAKANIFQRKRDLRPKEVTPSWQNWCTLFLFTINAPERTSWLPDPCVQQGHRPVKRARAPPATVCTVSSNIIRIESESNAETMWNAARAERPQTPSIGSAAAEWTHQFRSTRLETCCASSSYFYPSITFHRWWKIQSAASKQVLGVWTAAPSRGLTLHSNPFTVRNL